ncbi:heavy-metal-associated domain-containing protein [Stenotrophomonas maltophilia]|uniref:heavy-metal-associated domain-containing protein n=1 Tax=Stenotrophomonas maltophilia TaxID=40324 RepID=UPI0002B8C0FF|nr:heavy-metal-associated domain-containing protein [Stenotrophomonas maltophilia]EMF60431.1 Copper chaperone [Stenotrophomonas maltophilia EPM1]
MEFHVDGMTCGGCARSVTRAIQQIDPNASVVADPPTRRPAWSRCRPPHRRKTSSPQ